MCHFHLFVFHGYITNSHFDQLSAGLITQLTEHCNANRRVMDFNPIQAWIIFRLLFCNFLCCIHNCGIPSCIKSFIHGSCIWYFTYFTSIASNNLGSINQNSNTNPTFSEQFSIFCIGVAFGSRGMKESWRNRILTALRKSRQSRNHKASQQASQVDFE